VLEPTVRKPVVRFDGRDSCDTVEEITSNFGYRCAPPGSEPVALVSEDFCRNPTRLLALIPAGGASLGTWDAGQGVLAQVLAWAEANYYAVVLFSGSAMQEDPANTWDSVTKACPSRYVTVLALRGAMPLLTAALSPVNPLLYSRLRTVCEIWEDDMGGPPDYLAPGLPADLLQQLSTAVVSVPVTWASFEPYAMCQCLFGLLVDREEKFQKAQAKKYDNLTGMKENDLPGFKRLTMDERVGRLNRDRRTDELSRVMKQNEQAMHDGLGDDDEPGVD